MIGNWKRNLNYMISRLLVYLFLSIFMVPSAFSQVYQGARYEKVLDREDDDFLIVSADENGLFLSRMVKNKETKRDFKYELIHLDTALQVKWELFDYVDLEYKKVGYDFIDPYVYFLFRSSLKTKRFKVIRFEKETQAKEVFDFETEYDLEMTEFEVIDETLIFGGYVNNRPTFVCYKFGSATPIVLPGFRNEPNQIMQLEVEEKKGIFNVLLNHQTPDKKRSISLRTFDTNGNLLIDYDLQPQGDYGLIYGRSVAINEERHIVVGTYSHKKSDLSRGIFVSTIESNGDHVINYYNYADLKNFFNYLKAKREIRIKKKIARRKIKGKKNKFHYKLLVHDIIEYKDQYIMVGEAFYPKYSYTSPGYATYNPYYTGGSFFEGYAYTHAVVIGFDHRGKILWDNSFEIQDIVTFNLRHYVHAGPVDDGIVLLYVYNNEIRMKIIQGTQVLDIQDQIELKTNLDKELIDEDDVNSEYGGLEDWYGKTYFAFGIQEIKDSESMIGAEKTDIFFINKVILK